MLDSIIIQDTDYEAEHPLRQFVIGFNFQGAVSSGQSLIPSDSCICGKVHENHVKQGCSERLVPHGGFQVMRHCLSGDLCRAG